MAKRFTDTEKWKDDWYLSLSNDYKIVWQWLLDNCSHAGICKRSIGFLRRMCGVNFSEEEILKTMEGRVIVINETHWFIPKFLKFQYKTLKSSKPAVVSVIKELLANNCYAMIPESFGNDYRIVPKQFNNGSGMVKDKDMDMDKDKKKKDSEEIQAKNEDSNSKSGEIPEKNCLTEEQFESVKTNFKNDFRYREKFCRESKITEAEFSEWRDRFLSKIIRREDFKTLKELKSHFTNWYDEQLAKKPKTNGKAPETPEEIQKMFADFDKKYGTKPLFKN